MDVKIMVLEYRSANSCLTFTPLHCGCGCGCGDEEAGWGCGCDDDA